MRMKVSQREKTVSHLKKQRVLNNRVTVHETDILFAIYRAFFFK